MFLDQVPEVAYQVFVNAGGHITIARYEIELDKLRIKAELVQIDNEQVDVIVDALIRAQEREF